HAVVAAVGDLVARVLLAEAAEALAVPDLADRLFEQIAEHDVVRAAGPHFARGRDPDRRPRLAAHPRRTLFLHLLNEVVLLDVLEARAELQSEVAGAALREIEIARRVAGAEVLAVVVIDE